VIFVDPEVQIAET